MIGDNVQSENEEIQLNWNKLEKKLTKVGLKDGISDGRDSNFQENFDKGFHQGFRNAYLIGRYKSIVCCKKELNPNFSLQEHELLDEPNKAWCQICANSSLLNKDILHIITQQSQVCEKNKKSLHDVYHCTVTNKSNNSDYLIV